MNGRKSLGIGSVSLILVFCVLCLTVFALLTLSCARTEYNLAEKLAQSTESYYTADTRAALALADAEAALGLGESPNTAQGLEIACRQGEGAFEVSFLSPIDENRAISVLALYRDGETEILEWREISTGDWTPDEGLDVLYSN